MRQLNKRFILFPIILFSCNTTEDITPEDKNFTIPDWTEASHGKVQPDYETVFPQTKVNTIEITMTTTNWSDIQTNMKAINGTAFGGGNQPGGGNQMGGAFSSAESDYIGVSLKFNNKQWYKVGFRLKGNSTLHNSWRSGIYKLPFRLNFDKFEDDYPQIEDQRFFGFKELSMSPGANDNSLIREKVSSDIFRMAGIPCAKTAFYKVYINFGDGLKYCGVYTMVEVIDDSMIKNQFGEDKGNIYKPESTFQNFVASQFEKKNNETKNDFTDVQSTIAILNSSLRTTNPSQWRNDLGKNFNTNHFIKWLAVNTTMVNWDTYGSMAHNHYLFNDPNNKLTWIPWDNNEAMLNKSMNSNGGNSVSLPLTSVTSNWPLIRYIADDPVYYAQYKIYVREFADQVFTSTKMNDIFDRYHTLISPYVIGPEENETGKYTHLSSTSSFTNELSTLKQHVVARKQSVDAFVP